MNDTRDKIINLLHNRHKLSRGEMADKILELIDKTYCTCKTPKIHEGQDNDGSFKICWNDGCGKIVKN